MGLERLWLVVVLPVISLPGSWVGITCLHSLHQGSSTLRTEIPAVGAAHQ